MVYKHVIGLKTDVSQSNLGGNTDSNHLIPGVVGHFPSVSLRRRPIQLVILIPFFFSPASDAGFSLFCAPPCISAPVSILPDAIRPFRMSFPRHRMPVFFPLYGEVRSSLLRFNPATISRPLRTSTSRPFRMSIPRHSMPAFILSIVPWRIALTWQFEREEPRGAMLRPRL